MISIVNAHSSKATTRSRTDASEELLAPDVRDRLKERRAEIDSLNATALTLQQQLQSGPTSIAPAAVAKFGKIVRQRLIADDSKARQRIVQGVVKTARVGSTIKIEGETSALTRGVAALAREKDPVLIFDRSWCATQSGANSSLADISHKYGKVVGIGHLQPSIPSIHGSVGT